MLLGSSIPMTRKALAVAVVLILSSLAPATAMIGFCARMPCCFGHAHGGPAVASNDADCCTTVSCDERPSQDLIAPVKAKTMTACTPAVFAIAVAVPPTPPVVRSAFDDTSPPRTAGQRLASLSILLI
jgi:hypothetical protein